MKKKVQVILLACGGLIAGGCNKNSPPDYGSTLRAYLIDGPWQLISATQYNPTGAIVSKISGSIADSVLFNSAPDANQNVILTSLVSFIGGNKAFYSYQVVGDTAVAISPAWKSGFSDTMVLLKPSDDYVTLLIRKKNDPFISFELDSLKKIRFYR